MKYCYSTVSVSVNLVDCIKVTFDLISDCRCTVMARCTLSVTSVTTSAENATNWWSTENVTIAADFCATSVLPPSWTYSR